MSVSTSRTRTRAARTILRFVDAQLTAAHREAIQRLDGLDGLGLRHLDEAEAARTTGFAVSRQRDVLDSPVLREQVAHLGLGRRERQVSNIDLHDSSLSLISDKHGRTRPPREGRPAIHNGRKHGRDSPGGQMSSAGRIFDQRSCHLDRARGASVGAENSTGHRPKTLAAARKSGGKRAISGAKGAKRPCCTAISGAKAPNLKGDADPAVNRGAC